MATDRNDEPETPIERIGNKHDDMRELLWLLAQVISCRVEGASYGAGEPDPKAEKLLGSFLIDLRHLYQDRRTERARSLYLAWQSQLADVYASAPAIKGGVAWPAYKVRVREALHEPGHHLTDAAISECCLTAAEISKKGKGGPKEAASEVVARLAKVGSTTMRNWRDREQLAPSENTFAHSTHAFYGYEPDYLNAVADVVELLAVDDADWRIYAQALQRQRLPLERICAGRNR